MTLNWPLPADETPDGESPASSPVATSAAAPSASPSPAAATRTFATFVVNAEDRGEHVVLLKDGAVFAKVKDLREAGIVVPQPAVDAAINGYIPLTALAPQFATGFDPLGPSIHLDAVSPASLTQRSSVSVVASQDWRGDARRDRSGYLDYSAAIGSGGFWSTAEALTISDASKTLFLAGSLSRSGLQRSVSNLTWDDAARRHIITVGDVFGDSGQLGSTQIVEGVAIARSYASTPYLPRLTSPTLSGTALTPTVADIYVNGQLIRAVDVPPGAFDFSSLPAGGGPNNAQIVLHDAFGNVRLLSARYYGGSAILRDGDTDFSYAIGEGRNAAGFGPASEGIVAFGRYAVGLSRTTTASGHVELGTGFENVAGGYAHAGRLGVVSLGIAQSRDRGVTGMAAIAGYTFATPNVWLTASIDAATRAYETIAQRFDPDPIVMEQSVDIGTRPFRGNYTVGFNFDATRSRLGNVTRDVSWQQTLPVGPGMSLLVSVGESRTSIGSHPTLSVLLIRSSGRNARDTTTASLQGTGGALRPSLEMQQAPPYSGGFGYDAILYPTGDQLSTGRYSLRTSIGDLDADYGLARDGKLSGDVAASGAVAFAGKDVALSQPIADGFAIVDVAGGESADVLINDQDYGMTGRRGLLVLPNLQGYYEQRVGIQRDDGPVNLDISSADQNVVVASHRGTVLDFHATLVTAAIGTVIVLHEGELIVPAFGELTLTVPSGVVTSELDGSGRFYFENIVPGAYGATVRYANGDCELRLHIPHIASIEENIGAFTCVQP